MKTSSYNIGNTMAVVGAAFDFAVNACKIDGNAFWNSFVCSGIAEQIENNNPKYSLGKSGEELAYDVFLATYGSLPEEIEELDSQGHSPEYWAGVVLTGYQIITNTTFKGIHELIGFGDVIYMYDELHEAPISKFIEIINELKANTQTNIKLQRDRVGLSQSELARLSGVNIKTIQAYEQRQKNVGSAKYETLITLSTALGCKITDIL